MSSRTRANLSDFSANLTTVSQTVLPAYFGRNILILKNNGPSACAVNLTGGTAATNTSGSLQLASDQRIVFQKNVPQNAISAISAGVSNLTIQADQIIASPPSFVIDTTPAPSIDFNFSTGQYWINPTQVTSSGFTCTRATVATDLLPVSTGSSFNNYGVNDIRIIPGSGLLAETAATNQLLNSTAPATQNTGVLGVATYTCWVNGSGSATVAGSPTGGATATVVGGGVATQGTPLVFSVTVGGTVNVAVTGSLNAFQLEAGAYGTSLIVTSGAALTRNADVISRPISVSASYAVFCQAFPLMPITYPSNQYFVALSDGTNNNRIGYFRSLTSGVFQYFVNAGGAGGSNGFSAVATPINTSAKMVATFINNTQTGVINAGVSTTTAITMPTYSLLTTLGIFRGDAILQGNGFVQRIALWSPTTLSTADMQRITA